jgi:hypothetical protein
MQIILTHDEKRKLFKESLQYLAESLQDWNFTLDFNRTEFEMAKQILKRKSSVVTYDELFTEMVFNNWELKFIDNEDEDAIGEAGGADDLPSFTMFVNNKKYAFLPTSSKDDLESFLNEHAR